MGVRINPCYRCPLREGCEQRDEFRRRVAGMGAISVAFKCDKLGTEVRQGRRIMVSAPVASGFIYGETLSHKAVTATIMSVDSRYSFSCIVDPGQIDEDDLISESATVDSVRFRKTAPHWRIVRFLDEPDGKFCSQGQLLRDGRCDIKDGECWCRQFYGSIDGIGAPI